MTEAARVGHPRRAGRAVDSRTPPDVLDAALSVFARHGYDKATINEIGDALNIRGPSLYHHISSKYQLLVDIVVGWMTHVLQEQEGIIAATDDPVEQLRGVVDHHVLGNARDPRQSFVATREMIVLREPERSQVVALRSQWERNLLAVVERGVAQGVFKAADPVLATRAIIAMGIHVSMWFKNTGPLTPEIISREYQEYALGLLDAAHVSADDM